MQRKGIRIARFFGVNLMLDYTWFILLFLVKLDGLRSDDPATEGGHYAF